jgi:hypothetical protein
MVNTEERFYIDTVAGSDRDSFEEKDEEVFFFDLEGEHVIAYLYRKKGTEFISNFILCYDGKDDIIFKVNSTKKGNKSEIFQSQVPKGISEIMINYVYSIMKKIDKRFESFEKQIKDSLREVYTSYEDKEFKGQIWNEKEYNKAKEEDNKDICLQYVNGLYVISSEPLKDIVMDIKCEKATCFLKDGKVIPLTEEQKKALKEEGVEY